MLLPFIACFALILFARGQTGGSDNLFFSPPKSDIDEQYGNNPVWELGSTQNISWTTQLNNYSIILWQQDLTFAHSTPGVTFYAKVEGSPAVTEFEWTVQTFNFDLAASKVFFLGLNWALTQDGFTSHYFNISQKAASSSTAAATSAASPSSTPASASRTTSVPSSPSNKGLKVGLGVSLGLGIPIAFAIGVFLGFRLVKKRQYGGVSQELDQVTRYDPGLVDNGQQKHELPGSGAHDNRVELRVGSEHENTRIEGT